ncbi:MAG: hypothetical protein H9864_05500, partial [Candidatus Faecalibacterium intestinavium]|nr:hypothetical protein [Candidatus Faecalibacterium intestinavium]
MATQLGAMAVGSIVKLNVDGVPTNFIVVNQGIPKNSPLYDASCNGTWLLMYDIYEKRPWHSLDDNDYGNSATNIYLNSTFLGLLDEDIQAAISQIRIPYHPGHDANVDINSGANGLPCKVFLLSGYEVGWTSDNEYFPEDGALLEYFLPGTSKDANIRRKAIFDGDFDYWGLRTPNSRNSNYVWYTIPDGSCTNGWSSTVYGVRPAFILPPSLFVDAGFAVTNLPPEAPASITVPELVKGGGDLPISWAAASDPDGDPMSYELERSTDAAEWAQIYKGEALRFTDRITKGWLSVQYRVRAVDSGNLSSGWTESETRTVDNNTAPAIECEHPGGGDLGEKAEPFAVNYTVTDPDGDPLTLTETVDGQTTRT